MPRPSDKRDRLVGAATRLFHEQGFHRTALADIAGAAGVPLGNVYYYFKTKDDLGAAVAARHREGYRACFARWEREREPLARVERMIDALVEKRATIAKHGCQTGSLCQELDKDGGLLARHADANLRAQIDWVAAQLRAAGRADDAEALAEALVAGLQGACVLAQALSDPETLARRGAALKGWLRAL